MIGNRGVSIIAKRNDDDGYEVNEVCLVHETALVPVYTGWFVVFIPAVHLVAGMIIPCQIGDQFLVVQSIAILDDSKSPG
jgi:hypothetical protein